MEDRPNGADDMEFTDEGRTIVLLPGDHCVNENGLTASVSASGEISLHFRGEAEEVNNARRR